MTDVVAERLRAAGCLYAEEEAELLRAAGSGPELDRLVAERVAGTPLEHLLGSVRFAGLDLAVGPGVFVPRQRSAFLAETAVELAGRRPTPVVVDLCTGCGAIAAVVAQAMPSAQLTATDSDEVALAYARRNLPTAQIHQGDLFEALPAELRGTVDVLTANVPYVPTAAIAAMPPEARDHEPRATLDGGADGLDVARRVASGAAAWLAPEGTLLIEVGDDQVDAASALMRDAGLTPDVRRDEERGATVVTGTASLRTPPVAQAVTAIDDVVPEVSSPATEVYRDRAPAMPYIGVLFAIAAVVTVPWAYYLAASLPERQTSANYGLAWAGFDLFLVVGLASTAYAVLRRSPWVGMSAGATAALLVTDAWFDVMTAPTWAETWQAVAMAAFAELPLAAVCVWLCRHADVLADRRIRILLGRTRRGGEE